MIIFFKKPKVLWTSLVLLFTVFLFYWFQLRPSQIRTECEAYTHNYNKDNDLTMTQFNFVYNACLHRNGI